MVNDRVKRAEDVEWDDKKQSVTVKMAPPFLKHSAVYSLYRGRTGKSDREAYPQEYTDPQDRRQDYKKKTGEIRQHGSDR